MDVFRAMQAFVATVRNGSMRAAADELGMTSAMVGQHIAALEARLDTRVLNRTTRSQSLTDFGESYFAQCTDILDRIAATEEDAQSLQSAPRGRLRITAPVSFGTEVLAPALARYRESAPDVVLDVNLTDRDVDLIDEGIDIAFRIGKVADSRIIARPLGPYRMTLCAAPVYLQRKGIPQHPSDLNQHDAVTFAQTHGHWKFARDDEQFEVMPTRSVTLNSGRAIVNAACAGLGVILQPHFLCEQDITAGRLQSLLMDWQWKQRNLSVLYYRDSRMTPRLRRFIHFALREFKVMSS